MYRDQLIGSHLADSILVLDGGTGFLKVGYAAQVKTKLHKLSKILF